MLAFDTDIGFERTAQKDNLIVGLSSFCRAFRWKALDGKLLLASALSKALIEKCCVEKARQKPRSTIKPVQIRMLFGVEITAIQTRVALAISVSAKHHVDPTAQSRIAGKERIDIFPDHFPF